MKQWVKQTVVCTPIDEVWKFTDGSLNQMQNMDPAIVGISNSHLTEEVVGSTYTLKYYKKDRMSDLDVRIVEYFNKPMYKGIKVIFTYKQVMEASIHYELFRVGQNKTHFRCTYTSEIVKWWARWLMLFANEQYLVELMERVREVYHTNRDQ